MEDILKTVKVIVVEEKPAYRISVAHYGDVILFGSFPTMDLVTTKDFKINGVSCSIQAEANLYLDGQLRSIEIVKDEYLEGVPTHQNTLKMLKDIKESVEVWTTSSVGLSMLITLEKIENLKDIARYEEELSDVASDLISLEDRIEVLKERQFELKNIIKDTKIHLDNLNQRSSITSREKQFKN